MPTHEPGTAAMTARQEALGPEEAGFRSHKQWMLSLGAEGGTGVGTATANHLQPGPVS